MRCILLLFLLDTYAAELFIVRRLLCFFHEVSCWMRCVCYSSREVLKRRALAIIADLPTLARVQPHQLVVVLGLCFFII